MVFAGASAQTIYALVYNSAGSVWNGSAFVAYNNTNRGTYAIALTETSTTGVYIGTTPVVGVFDCTTVYFVQAGGSPAITDTSAAVEGLFTTPAGVLQTGDSFARVGAPVGASISADLASVQADTDNLQTRVPAALVSGRMDSSVGAMAADVVTAAAIATDAIGSNEVAASAVTKIQSGLATAAALATVQADTDDMQTRLPAALVGGRMDSSVGAMATDTLTSGALASSAVTEIQSGLATAAALATVQADTDDLQTRVPAALSADGSMKASLQAVLGTAFTEGVGGQIAAAFKKFFNVAAPAATMDHGVLVDTVTTLTNAPADSSGVSSLLSSMASLVATVAALPAAVWAVATRTLSAFSFTVDTNANATETAIKASTDLIPADPATLTALAAAVTSMMSSIAANSLLVQRGNCQGGTTTSIILDSGSSLVAHSVDTLVILLPSDHLFATISTITPTSGANVVHIVGSWPGGFVPVSGHEYRIFAMPVVAEVEVDPASIQAGMDAQGYSSVRAGYLDNLDAPISLIKATSYIVPPAHVSALGLSQGVKTGKGFQAVKGSDNELLFEIWGLHPGVTVTEARLVVKSDSYAEDADALVSKLVTTTAGLNGSVSNDIQSGSVSVLFKVSQTDTEALTASASYYYAVRLGLSDGTEVRPVLAQGDLFVQPPGVEAMT